jgi:hypothetical protein
MGAAMVKIGNGLEIPIDDLVTRRTAILAKTGAGKSNTAKVIVEGVLDHGAQVVILDPVGHWWGLRSLHAIPVLGGMSGDVPLDPLAGKLLARVAVESGHPLVLDLSQMDSDGQMQRFAYEFAEEFFKLKQASPTACLLVLEEADEFAPQDTRGANTPRMVGAFNRIAKRGRGRGIGMLSVTLRSAALSKNVLNQSDTLIAMRTTAPLDLAAVKEWVQHTRAAGAEEVIPSLPGLETGVAWWWSPEDGILRRLKVAKARSLDTSATPKVGDVPVDQRKRLKPIDLDQLGAEMAAVAEKAKEDDPSELRRRIRMLEAELTSREAHGEPPPIVTTVEVPVMTDAHVDAITESAEKTVETLLLLQENFRTICEGLIDRYHAITQAASTLQGKPAPERVLPQPPPAEDPARRATPPAPPSPGANGDGGLPPSEQKIVDAVRWFEILGIAQPTRLQVAFIAGYKPTGGRFQNLLGELRRLGLIDYPTNGTVSLTEEGERLAGRPDIPMSNEALHGAVAERLDGSQAKLMAALIERWPKAMTREQLAEATGYDVKGGRFQNLLGSLRTIGLVHYPARGHVVADDALFPLSTAGR